MHAAVFSEMGEHHHNHRLHKGHRMIDDHELNTETGRTTFVMLIDQQLQPVVVNRDLVVAIGLPAPGTTGSVLLLAGGLQLAVALNQLDVMARLNDPSSAPPASPLLAPLN